MPADGTIGALRRLSLRPIVIASHPRSGTHMLIDLLRRQFAECRSWKWPGEKLNRLYLNIEAVFDPAARAPLGVARALGVLRRVARPLVKTHLLPPPAGDGEAAGPGEPGWPWLDWLRRAGRVIYVYRDGRDVMCSYHFFSKIDPAARCPIGRFMRQTRDGVSRVRFWADHVRCWRREQGVIAVRFEDARADPRATLAHLGEELGLAPDYREPLLPRPLESVWASRLARVAGIRPRSTAIVSRLRGHRLERWREAFTAADREFFDREAGDLLVELGYEQSRDWVAA